MDSNDSKDTDIIIPPFPLNIMYIYVMHALQACYCRSKINQYLHDEFLLKFKKFSVVYLNNQFDSWQPYERHTQKYQT